jgi:HK97 family phage major capsid protein
MYGYEKETEMIAKLSEKIYQIDKKVEDEGRALTAKEAGLRSELEVAIDEIRKGLPQNSPLTLQNFSSDSGASDRAILPARGRTFRAMFGYSDRQKLETGGFKDTDEFIAAVFSGRFDPRLVRASMGETVPSEGGFSVPSEFSSLWLDASLPTELVRNLCQVFPMAETTLQVPGWDGADMSAGATHGGFTMTFMAEGSTATPQTPKMRQIMLTAKVGGIYCDASLELAADGKNFERNLQTALTKSIGYGLDRFCIAGSGAGCPQGFLNATCKVQVTKESGQRVDTVVYQNIKKMFARQLNPGNAVWLFNATAIPELLEQSVAVGTGGSFVPLLNESNGKFTIFGRPVYFHPAMPTLGDADDCAFVDFNFYALGLRQEVAIDISDAPRWLQRERSFRILMRFDGQCTLNSAISPEHGLSLSPVVTLAERA